jgi:hypothetical protein
VRLRIYSLLLLIAVAGIVGELTRKSPRPSRPRPVVSHLADERPDPKLLGTESTFSSGIVTLEKEGVWAVEFTCEITGIVETIEMPTATTANTATEAKLGMFAERTEAQGDDNYPGVVLAEKAYTHAGSIPTSTTISATGFSVPVTKGKKYWLAVLPVNGSLHFQHGTESTAFFHFFPFIKTFAEGEEEIAGNGTGLSGNPGEKTFAMKAMGVESSFPAARHKIVGMA